MQEDTNEDVPKNFYLNGIEMPPHTGEMHELLDWYHLSNEFKDNWHAELTYHQLWIWLVKWDASAARVRSLESGNFLILCQELLKILHSKRSEVEQDILRRHPRFAPAVVPSVVDKLVYALLLCREIAVKNPVCFWVRGGEVDNEDLKETMRCCALPTGAPDFMEYPHLTERRNDRISILEHQQRELEQLGLNLPPSNMLLSWERLLGF